MSHFKKSFTLVELIMTMVIIGVLASLGTWFFVFLADNFLFTPVSLNMDMVVSDILDIVCEGDSQAGGLRFAQNIIKSDPNRVEFIDGDGRTVIINVSKAQGKVERSIDGAPFQPIPYYIPSSLRVRGKGGKTFNYFFESGTMKGIAVRLIAQIGQEIREIKSGVALRK